MKAKMIAAAFAVAALAIVGCDKAEQKPAEDAAATEATTEQTAPAAETPAPAAEAPQA